MTNLKKFNLERALAGDPVVTRDGRKVTEIYNFKTFKDRDSVIAIIDKEMYFFNKNGTYNPFEEDEHENDLFMAPKTKKVYLYVCKTVAFSSHSKLPVFYTTSCYSSIEEATKNFLPNIRWQLVEVELEDVEDELTLPPVREISDLNLPPVTKTKNLWIAVGKYEDDYKRTFTSTAIADLDLLKKDYTDAAYHFIQIEIPEE